MRVVEPGPLLIGEIREHLQTYYQNQLNIHEAQPLNNMSEFSGTVEEIQNEAEKERERLKD